MSRSWPWPSTFCYGSISLKEIHLHTDFEVNPTFSSEDINDFRLSGQTEKQRKKKQKQTNRPDQKHNAPPTELGGAQKQSRAIAYVIPHSSGWRTNNNGQVETTFQNTTFLCLTYIDRILAIYAFNNLQVHHSPFPCIISSSPLPPPSPSCIHIPTTPIHTQPTEIQTY